MVFDEKGKGKHLFWVGKSLLCTFSEVPGEAGEVCQRSEAGWGEVPFRPILFIARTRWDLSFFRRLLFGFFGFYGSDARGRPLLLFRADSGRILTSPVSKTKAHFTSKTEESTQNGRGEPVGKLIDDRWTPRWTSMV